MNITKAELEAVRGSRRDLWMKAFDAIYQHNNEYTHAELVAVLLLRSEKAEEPVQEALPWST